MIMAVVMALLGLLNSFDIVGNGRVAKFRVSKDENAAVRTAVADLAAIVKEKTGVTLEYSGMSSALGGDIFVCTQPWAAKAAWSVHLKNNIIAIHGSDFEGTERAVREFTERYVKPAKGATIGGWTKIDFCFGPQPEDVFETELKRVEELRRGNRDWENECVTSRNREPARAYSYPLARVEDAFTPDEPASPFVLSLNGVWKFNWCGSPKQRPTDFYRADFDDSEWFELGVPSCVEAMGYGQPIFTNIEYAHRTDPPFIGDELNPVSSYRRRFTIPTNWRGRKIHLRFEGVASAYYVWVNGKKVGYAEDSMLASEFDITEHLSFEKENLLAVEVYRWSDGSYLEDQDRFEFSGIHRDVTIWAEPKDAIHDFCVRTENSGKIEVECDGAEWKLYDANYKEVSTPVKNVRLWSAEDPYLYTLVMTKGDDIRTCKVGFREIRLGKTGAIEINGRKIKMRGVNWREFSPTNGFTMSRAEILADVKMLKQYNFDCVRTCHNAMTPYFYQLCDRFGIYVQCEANVESHGMWYGVKCLAYPPSWAKPQIERGARMVAEFRNFPCIFQWSLGNEAGSGPNFVRMHAAMKELDDTRLYINRNDNENFAIHGHGYLSLEEMERLAKWCPYFMSEYAHAMGNSMGNFKEYWQVMRKYDTLQGGCIWDWVDQVVPIETDRIGHDGKRIVYDGYGGDFDDSPNEGAGCVNGVIDQWHRPTPKLMEVAHVQQELEVSNLDINAGVADFENRAAFTFADAYEGEWSILEDGIKINSGRLEVPHLAPQTKGRITLPISGIGRKSGREYFCNVAFKLKADTLWAPKGWVVAKDQLSMGIEKKNTAVESRQTKSGKVTVADGDNIEVNFGESKAEFSKKTGTLSKLEMCGKIVLADEQGICRGPRLTCARAFTDGDDRSIRDPFLKAGLGYLKYHPHPVKVRKLADGAVEVSSVIEVDGMKACGFRHESTYFFRGDGSLVISNRSTPKGDLPRFLPRLGLSMMLDERLENITYYGRGPYENYIDRNTASDIAIWNSTVTEQFTPYVRPQDCGSHCEVRWLALTDKTGDGVLIKGSVPLFTQALHYGWRELFGSRHRGNRTHDAEGIFSPLVPRKEVCLNLDLRQLGLGNANCGPRTLIGYTFKNKVEEWSVTILPITSASSESLSATAREIDQRVEAEVPRSLESLGKGYDGG